MAGFDKRYVWAILPVIGGAIGNFLDRKETERMVRFRDKSALYGHPADLHPDKPKPW